MTFKFSENSSQKILLEWLKRQEKKQFTMQDVLNADIEISIS